MFGGKPRRSLWLNRAVRFHATRNHHRGRQGIAAYICSRSMLSDSALGPPSILLEPVHQLTKNFILTVERAPPLFERFLQHGDPLFQFVEPFALFAHCIDQETHGNARRTALLFDLSCFNVLSRFSLLLDRLSYCFSRISHLNI